MKRNILITGGAGFIGSHVVRLFVNKYPNYHIFNLDKLTYAGNLENVADVANAANYTFIQADICDYEAMKELFVKYHIDGVIHLAAESHVDRSIEDPFIFTKTQRSAFPDAGGLRTGTHPPRADGLPAAQPRLNQHRYPNCLPQNPRHRLRRMKNTMCSFQPIMLIIIE